MKFTKMHGTGNDYIYVYEERALDFSALAIELCKTHVGIGGDGIIHIYPTEEGRFAMEMFNADGSEGAMCGNGIRCVGKYLYDFGHTRETHLEIETKAGLRHLALALGAEGTVEEVVVSMGMARDMEEIHLNIEGKQVEGHYISMGNPHFVMMCHDPEEIALDILGPAIETHPQFPEGVNVEFYTPTEDGFSMRVWERGSGETQSCGTGACACFAVGQRLGVLDQGPLTAYLTGGALHLWEEEGEIMLKGEAVTVFQGEIELI